MEGGPAEGAPILAMSGVVDAQGRVRAAGGVVLRDGAVLVVHRPRYDDWSFPKGKADHEGESDEDSALREVREETGLRCELGRPLPAVSYTDHHGRPKIVRYWCMRAAGGAFRPADEVDEIRWLPPSEARSLLTYDHDRALVDAIGDCADA
jgi:8-oxo-dGTP pyrophosphatase MutT (NUDIX family)